MMTSPVIRGTILDRIVAARRTAVSRRMHVLPQAALRIAVEKGEAPRDFAAALTSPGTRVIAEMKRASPSRGLLRDDYDPGELASAYGLAGAAAISALTEEEFFQGSLADMRAARRRTTLPVLRKDFIVDEWQVWETRAADADSFLLIASLLSGAALKEFLNLGRSMQMEPLVEVHTREELERALSAGARIIGVNNRDLRDFSVRLEISLELIESIPDECLAVSESGIRTVEDIARLHAAGFDAFLVGEHLMESADPGAALRALLGPVT